MMIIVMILIVMLITKVIVTNGGAGGGSSMFFFSPEDRSNVEAEIPNTRRSRIDGTETCTWLISNRAHF